MKKRTITSALLICCLLASCSSQKEKKTVEAVRVETETVTNSNFSLTTASYVGEVEEQSSTAVSFSGSGTIQKIYVNEGQHVAKGQLIAIIDDTQSRNSLMAAEAMMTQAQDAYDRMKILHDRQSLSEMEWVQVQANLQQTKSNLQKSQKALSDCRLTAPCSGVIGTKMLESGMTALPAEPICNILDISKVKVKISVPEKEIMKIPSNAIIVVDALDGMQFESSNFERCVTADAVSRTYEVRYVVNNPDGKLLPGMVCTTMPHTTSELENSAPFVPITSVQRRANGEMFVWTVVHGEAHRTIVKVGEAKGNRISVLKGIKNGDTVVTRGYQKLYENCKVK